MSGRWLNTESSCPDDPQRGRRSLLRGGFKASLGKLLGRNSRLPNAAAK